jgi:hypothetical protein
MSSLALYAAPFDNNENSNDNDKKRLARNKTIKKRIPSNGNIESLISKIHQNAENDTDDSINSNNLLGEDYSAPGMKLPMPVSIGANRKTNDEISKNDTDTDTDNNISPSHQQHNNSNSNSNLNSNSNSKGPKKVEPAEMGMDGFNTMNDRSNPENYDNSPYSTPYYINQTTTPNRDVLIEKLNYMIHLLEEHRDEKVDSITEEIILYSFLGIFIIFIVDSFARAGKYVR